MSKAVRGTKRHCRNCGAKFYDLGRDPIVCPVCQTAYQAHPATAPAPRAAPVAAARPPVEEEVVAPAAAGEPEFVSLEEAEAEEKVGVDDEEEIVDIDVDEDIPDDEQPDVFLEDDEEDETDVSGFVGGAPGADEER